jgi:predicted secreted protein
MPLRKEAEREKELSTLPMMVREPASKNQSTTASSIPACRADRETYSRG